MKKRIIRWKVPNGSFLDYKDAPEYIEFEHECEKCNAEEHRELYAKGIGYENWDDLVKRSKEYHVSLNYHINEVMEMYAEFKHALWNN